jgi:hypothetical protein
MSNLDELRRENEELKALLHEGKEIFGKITDILNLKKIAQSNMLFAKLPGIIRKVQENPAIIEEVLQFVNKLNKYENTGTGQ